MREATFHILVYFCVAIFSLIQMCCSLVFFSSVVPQMWRVTKTKQKTIQFFKTEMFMFFCLSANDCFYHILSTLRLVKIQNSVCLILSLYLSKFQLNAVTFNLNSYFEMLHRANRIPPTIRNVY